MSDYDTKDPKADATRGNDPREERDRPDRADEPRAEGGSEFREPPRGAEPEAGSSGSEDPAHGVSTELEILRDELAAVQRRLEDAEKEVEEGRERALRARAEVDTVRRRASGDQARAREAGMDGALLPVMGVFDDLRRALKAAEAGDPEQIVPGVRAVMEGLERNLDRLGIRSVGAVGEAFDPGLHEAISSVPSPGDAEAGTIAEIFETGFMHGDRLIRPARVVVYQDGQG